MENYKYIQDKLNNGKIVILDGANGSELEKRGAQMDRAGWCGPASITHPKILEDIHKDYITAGAEVITTNTFSSARHVLEYSTFKDQTVAINEKAMECAISARNHFPDKKVAIAGSISLSLGADIVEGVDDPAEFRDNMKLAQKTREVTECTEESIREGSFNYNKILKYNGLDGSPSVKRLVIKHLTKRGIINDGESYKLCDKMIVVGLQYDFFGSKGAEIVGIGIGVIDQRRLVAFVKPKFTGSGSPARVIKSNLPPGRPLIGVVVEIAPGRPLRHEILATGHSHGRRGKPIKISIRSVFGFVHDARVWVDCRGFVIKLPQRFALGRRRRTRDIAFIGIPVFEEELISVKVLSPLFLYIELTVNLSLAIYTS